MPRLKDEQHRSIAFWGLAMIAMGLPLSIFLMSTGMLVLAGNWLLEGNYIPRLKRFFSDPLSLAISSLFLLYCIGMLWTQDLVYGFKELKTKIPLFILPLVIFTSKLPNKKRLQDILLVFVVACMVGILFGMARRIGLSGEELLNKRALSVFISHIRFGLMLVFAFFILLYYLYVNWRNWSLTEKGLAICSMACILGFLIILEAFTAYIAFGIVSVVVLIKILGKTSSKKKAVWWLVPLTLLGLILLFQAYQIVDRHFQTVPFDYRTLTVKTLNGNYYAHQKDVPFTENGHRVWNFVCWDELESEWPKHSSFSLEGNDLRGQELRYTLIRYMASKGLYKDSAGLGMMSHQDFRNVENGYTNHLYTGKLGVSRRVNEMLRGWDKYRWDSSANNSSTFQRLVYFQVGLGILKNNSVVGVGTGDLKQAYRDSYNLDNRGLEERFQGISHNQYLTVGIMLGVVGLITFLLSIFYPLFLYRKDFLYVVFLTLMLVSFITDNTFNRQAGVILFAFFNSLLIGRKEFSETEP